MFIRFADFFFSKNQICRCLVTKSYLTPWIVTPWIAAFQTLLSSTISWSLLKFTSTESVMLSNHHALLSSSPFAFSLFPASGSFLMSQLWPKYWSFGFSISPSNEYSGLISFRMDWLDLLEVQGTLKSLLLHHSSKASVLQCSAFFVVQLLHPYMTTGKHRALTRWTLLAK